MFDVFTALKMIHVNHRQIGTTQIVIIDDSGKPNGLLTDLIRDVVGSIDIFINLKSVFTVDELLTKFANHTPLPTDVLSEYEKILRQPILGINFAPRKGQIELIFGG
ncbi:hypothetical protein [Paucilactobacillus sp. N302-9]